MKENYFSANSDWKHGYAEINNEAVPYLIPYIRIKQGWTYILNIRANIIKLSEDNVAINLHVFRLGNSLLNSWKKNHKQQKKKMNWT